MLLLHVGHFTVSTTDFVIEGVTDLEFLIDVFEEVLNDLVKLLESPVGAMLTPPGRLKWFLFMCSIRAFGLGTEILHLLQLRLMSTLTTEMEEFPVNIPVTGAGLDEEDDDVLG